MVKAGCQALSLEDTWQAARAHDNAHRQSYGEESLLSLLQKLLITKAQGLTWKTTKGRLSCGRTASAKSMRLYDPDGTKKAGPTMLQPGADTFQRITRPRPSSRLL